MQDNDTDSWKEMGLGKSLSLLALVCASLDSLADQERSSNDGVSRTTLIVTPKSSMFQKYALECTIIFLTAILSSNPWMAAANQKVPSST